MRGQRVIGVSIIIAILLTGIVSAAVIPVPSDGYTSVDTITPDDIFGNKYTVNAARGQRINYEFTVVGSGTIEVYFMKGGQSVLSAEYYVYYSKDTPVSSFSDVFPVGSDDGTVFDIRVESESSANISYNVNIYVDEPTAGDKAVTTLLIILVIMGIIVWIILKRRLRKKIWSN